MGLSAVAIASIVSAVSSAGSAAYSIKAQKKRGKEATHKEHLIEAKAAKKKELEKRKGGQSPGQRLLGGRPSLG